MSKPSKSTDAKYSQFGNFYQYVLAIELILESDEDEIIYLEKFGDISNSEISLESKHHIDSDNTLSDKHIDLRKTLYNWVNEYDKYIKYKKLIFHTTAKLPKGTSFSQWNDLGIEDRYNIVNSIIKTGKPETVEKYMNFIESYEEQKVKNIVGRVILSTHNENVSEKIKSIIKKDSIFSSVKNKDNKELLFHDILGIFSSYFLSEKEITKGNIFQYLRFKLKQYQEREYIFNLDYHSINEDISNYKSNKFLQEIIIISIPDNSQKFAIKDYCYANNLLKDMSSKEFLKKEIESYSTDLNNKLLIKKDKWIKDKDSFNLYYDCMDIDLVNSSYFENDKNFQNGNVHIQVDDNKFSWLYK